jgi:Flp pilus assembly protein TadB
MNKWKAQYVLLCGIAVEIFMVVVLFSALFGLVAAVPCGLLLIALDLNFDYKSRVAIFDWGNKK